MMKYRRGNLFLTVIVFLLLTMSIGSLFTLTAFKSFKLINFRKLYIFL